MAEGSWRSTHISDISPLVYEEDPGEAEWKPVRIHFGIRAFGSNAYVARRSGDEVIGEHTETDESGTRHEELYYVIAGHATFTVDGDEVDAPAGTFVYVRDPDASRRAVAHEPGTMVLCLGGTPGEAFAVSPWERKYDPDAA
jgi:oxalate decarboxylase/phosphoglucose isomerase-like protein (cupin superfamily)